MNEEKNKPDQLNNTFEQETYRLMNFWDKRYRDFSLNESGIMGLNGRYIRLLYRCKLEAYIKAISISGLTISDPIKILDAGCGQGFFAEQALNLFPQVRYTGVDISRKLIDHLIDEFPQCRWINHDFCDPEFDLGNGFNLIQSIEVLHLILSDVNHFNAIRNFAKCLVAGGTLIITDILPKKRMLISNYIVFRELDYYKNIFRELDLSIVRIFPMYFWIPDRGIPIFPFKYFFYFFPPEFIFRLDRFFLKLGVPPLLQSHDSAMKVLVIRKH